MWVDKADAGHDGWSDAIIVSLETSEVILPSGLFAAGLEVELRSQAGFWRVQFKSLLNRGDDYDHVEFFRVA